MRSLSAALVFLPLLGLSGCGYVHFGRLPAAAASDGAGSTAYSDLLTQQKILQTELALAHKEGDALRAALDNRTDGAASAQLTQRLTETTRELAALRASYAKLQAARPSAATDTALAEKLSATEEKLAASLRNYTELQEKNSRLQADLDRARAENTTLAAEVSSIKTLNEQAQAAVAQLNTELLAQKEARARADQQAEGARAQLAAVMAARDAPPGSLANARASSAASTSTLTLGSAPPADAPSTAELRTSPERLRAAAEKNPPAEKSAPPSRRHVVVAGDSLEKLAEKYYGNPAKWNVIYFANSALLSGGRPLQAGMELEIPPP